MKKSLLMLKLTVPVMACGLAAGAANAATGAPVNVCTFPGSPSEALDTQVALHVLKSIGVRAAVAHDTIGEGDDDGVSLKELGHILQAKCDIVAGFPRSNVADAAGSGLLFSRPYLRAGFVSFTRRDAPASHGDMHLLAATYGSPAQLIAVREKGATLDLETTPAATVAAVASGKAQRGIAWYPAVVAYERSHPGVRFTAHAVASDYADWGLVLAFGQRNAALREHVDAGLATMAGNGQLSKLTGAWRLAGDSATQPQASQAAGRADPDRVIPPASWNVAARPTGVGGDGHPAVVKVQVAQTGNANTMGPAFSKKQALHGQTVYAANCAKCHGDQLQGMNAPALQGPAFAPAKNSTLTIGGIFGYMQSNMPADQPGKLKPQDYADVMAFLLLKNGYQPSNATLTADKAQNDQTLLESHPAP